jgi:hypothetical protein
LTVTWAVAWGLIGPVLASGSPAEELERRMDSDSAWLAWLVMMNVTGPAPTELGETDTELLSM